GSIGNFGQKNLEGEQHAADWRVESCRDSGARACREQRDLLVRGEVEHLSEGRAQRRSDLNDRSLAPDRGARTDGEGGGQRLYDRHLPANIAALIEDCV